MPKRPKKPPGAPYPDELLALLRNALELANAAAADGEHLEDLCRRGADAVEAFAHLHRNFDPAASPPFVRSRIEGALLDLRNRDPAGAAETLADVQRMYQEYLRDEA